MRFKYAPLTNGKRQNRWLSGPDPIQHDKYYAFLKHRSQAHYRKEEYAITCEDWMQIWNDNDVWFNRGRKGDNVIMMRLDIEKPWAKDNVQIIERKLYLQKYNCIAENKRAKLLEAL